MKRSVVLLGALLCLINAISAAQPRPSVGRSRRAALVSFELAVTPNEPVNGSPILFSVRTSARLSALTGRWRNRRVFFDFDEGSGTWYGLCGVGIDAPPGTHNLVLTGSLPNGTVASSTLAVTIRKAAYRKIALRVPQRYTEPDPETLERIRQEQALKKEAFSRLTSARLWSGGFATPVNDVVTGTFGTERTFNRRRQSVHQGLDLRAGVGTPIAAMNSGEVVLAREMFYEGGFIVIDHGYGLITLYMHLSEMRVNVGDRVGKDQIIGLSGETGRVTAPHLHVAVRWQGLYLDPQTLIDMSFQEGGNH